MMIEKNGLDENAVEIRSKAHRVRTFKTGDKTLFAVCDILEACGVKAPRKWVERNATRYPGMAFTKLVYPTKTAKGYRRNAMYFCTAAVGKKLVSMTGCSDETERWLTEEVFTYKIEADSDKLSQEFEKYGEWAESLWHNLEASRATSHTKVSAKAPAEAPTRATKKESAEEDINQRIDRILLELLEIKRCITNGTTA